MNTPELDDLLDAAVLEGALAAGRGLRLATHQFGAARVVGATFDATTRPAHRQGQADMWSPADWAFLTRYAGILGDEEISAHLGRSANGVKIKRIRAGLPGPTMHPDYLTAHKMARALGVDVHAVCEWIERALLAAELAPLSDRKVWRVKRSAFVAWALRPANWIYFYRSVRQPARIRDARLRRLIARRAAVWGDEWWTTGEVARYHGVESSDVVRYIRAGKLPATRWQNWMVLKSAATRPGLRFYKGKGGTTFENYGTPAGDAFIVLAVAVGIPWTHISRMMRRRNHTSLQLRWGAMQRREGYIPWLIRAFDLPVRYRAADRAVWADWRAHAGRFPLVARAWDRWQRGEKLAAGERYALSGVGRAAVVWERGADDALARRLSGKGVPGAEVLATALVVYERVAGTMSGGTTE